MAQSESTEKSKVDKPTPFVVYFVSLLIGFIVFVPGFTGLMYLLKIHEYVDGEGLEFNVLVGLVIGLVFTIAFGVVFGYLANKQIIDMKE